jgi:hypothetical protein
MSPRTLHDVLPLLTCAPHAIPLHIQRLLWISLSGARGDSPNFYMRITFLRLFALSDPYYPDPIPAELKNTGFLRACAISQRQFPRPEVKGIAPHRQIDQRPQQDVFNLLSNSIIEPGKNHPTQLYISTSIFEKALPWPILYQKGQPSRKW